MVKTVEIRTMEGVQALAFEQTRNREGSFFCRAVKETFLATRSTRQSRFED
ncbi:MAG: hypothetical protein IK082_03585 [Oscillospiraceae bacterium]|nr:hypothetical protein [Oscillospiraceae bacterium]